jgi:hypothetical protein
VTLAGSKTDSIKIYYSEKFINLKNRWTIPCASYEKLPGYKAGKLTQAVVTCASQGK